MPYTHLRKGRFSQAGLAYHVTTVTLNRAPHFIDLGKGRKVVRELKTLWEQGKAETLCYVLMPDHLHWLMVLQESSLPEVMRLLKGRSARAIGHALWQANYYDHAVRREEDLRKLARYMVANPLRANLANNVGDYPLWDAVWLDDALTG